MRSIWFSETVLIYVAWCSIVMQNFSWIYISSIQKIRSKYDAKIVRSATCLCDILKNTLFLKVKFMKVGALDFYLLFKLVMLVITWVHYTALLSNDFNMNLFLQKRLLCQECNTKICDFKKRIEFWINDSHKISKCCCNY